MKRKNYSFDRQSVLGEAYHKFLKELFMRSQPSIDIDKYISDVKAGKIDPKKEDPMMCDRHYMAHELIKYISEKYKSAYRINSEWKENVDVVIKDLKEGGLVDKYVDGHTDEHGNHHPGYRDYDKRPSIIEILKDNGIDAETAEKVAKIFIERIEEIKDFYMFDSDERRWENTVWFGATPSSRKDRVIEFWKTQGKDIKIKDIPEEDYWYYDNGWSDRDIKIDKEEIEMLKKKNDRDNDEDNDKEDEED